MKESMSDVIRYDDGPARRIRALSGTAEMRTQRKRVIELLAPQPGERILDVGCGPGHLAYELAEIVGSRNVRGVDISHQMLEHARELGLDVVHTGDATLPFEDDVFDAAVATQVYEFVEDLPQALAELHRVLRPGGRALVLDTDWASLVWHASDSRRMERVLEGWRRRVANPHLPRTLASRLTDAGFGVVYEEAFVIFDPNGEADSYSVHQIEHLGTSAIGVPAEAIEAWANDLRDLARTGRYFFSLNRYIFVAVSAAAGMDLGSG
jgi:arsenite methyltransferase